jgi:hypothetical protein
MRGLALTSLGCLIAAACAAPYADSLSPPRPEICSVPRGWKRPTACARVVGTIVDADGRPVPNAVVFYTVLNANKNPEGIILMADADPHGNFQVTLYQMRGRATYPDTAAVRLGGSNVSPRGNVPRNPRWTGTVETVVTFVRYGGTLSVGTATIPLSHFVP